MSYQVNATFTVDVSNPGTVSAMAGAGSADERAQVQALADAGLNELRAIANRYGISISDSSVRVTSA